MKTITATIAHTWKEYGQLAAEITCQDEFVIQPGQYLSITTPDFTGTIPDICHPIHPSTQPLQIWPLPTDCTPGQEIILRGPMGHGFHIPDTVTKVCLIAWDHYPIRLLSILRQALQDQKEIILVWDAITQGVDTSSIPGDVEILPIQNIGDAIQWAEYIGMDCPAQNLPGMAKYKPDLQQRASTCPTQLLVSTSMPCLGIAECGICAVKTKKGYKLACKDGPVFDYLDLDLL